MAQLFQQPLFARLSRLASGTAFGQQWLLRRLIQAHSYPITVTQNQFAGPGWALLEQAVQASQAVLVGEDHGTAQIPLFTAALAQLLHPALFVAEVDPYQVQDLRTLAQSTASPTAYLQQHPGSLSFYSWVAEFELVRRLLDRQVAIVGIDHVFLASSGRFFTRLANAVKSPAFQQYLRELAHTCQAQDSASLLQNTPDFALFTIPAATIAQLLMLAQPEDARVQAMIQDYAASYAIYQGQLQGSGGHQQRVNLLKINLLHELQRHQQATHGPLLPKTLVKMGALHVARNLSPLVSGGYYDVGSLISNLAEAQSHTSLHLFVVGKQGNKTAGAYAEHEVAYTAEAAPAFLRYFLGQATTQWNITDLRPLRDAWLSSQLRINDQNLLRTVLGYDFLIVLPETTASGIY